MAQKVISMDAKLSAVFARSLSAAGRPNVSAVCAELGISRQSYYKYRRRFAAEGLAGLQERSRRPRFSPSRTPAVVEDAIVRARKELAEEGWDNGAVSIYYRLLADQAGCTVEEGPPLAVPSARTVHRVLVRLGLVVSDPAKRPRSSLRRFEFPATDDCWQIDATEVELQPATATAAPLKAVVFQVLDDHSRYEVASLAWPGEDGAGAWTVMTTAIARYGLPGLVLSDNGAAFSGARRGAVVAFEANLRALGTSPLTSRPYHPQTCGKNERVHRTWKQWMRRRDLHPATLAELQAALDTWRPAYNNRPHQALAGATPAQRRAAGMRTSPGRAPTPPRPASPPRSPARRSPAAAPSTSPAAPSTWAPPGSGAPSPASAPAPTWSASTATSSCAP